MFYISFVLFSITLFFLLLDMYVCYMLIKESVSQSVLRSAWFPESEFVADKNLAYVQAARHPRYTRNMCRSGADILCGCPAGV